MIDVVVKTGEREEKFTVEDHSGLVCFAVPEDNKEGSKISLYAAGSLGLYGVEHIGLWSMEQLYKYFVDQKNPDDLASVIVEMQSLPFVALRNIFEESSEEDRALVNEAWSKMQEILGKTAGENNGAEE